MKKHWSAVILISSIMLNMYIFRGNPIIARILELPSDLFHENIYSGSENNRVKLPRHQIISIQVDSWRIIDTRGTKGVAVKLYNGSEWCLSSIDYEITSNGSTRIFRINPMTDGEIYIAGPNRPLEAYGDIGDFAVNASTARIINAFGYKP